MKSCKLLILIAMIIGFAAARSHAHMSIHHINVGQGDATLLEFKSAAVLVDAGGSFRQGIKDHLIDYLDKYFSIVD